MLVGRTLGLPDKSMHYKRAFLTFPRPLRAMLLPIAIAAGLGLVAAQDVYSCPDGWQKEVI